MTSSRFFRPNINRRGRFLRAFAAFALAAGAFFTWQHSVIGGVLLGISSAFVAFEAARGWCALRACGVKTRF